jgi:hypothetical protein
MGSFLCVAFVLIIPSHHFNDKTKIWDQVKKQAKRFLPQALGGGKSKSIRSLGIRKYA